MTKVPVLEDLKEQLVSVLRQDIDPTYAPTFKGKSTGTRTITKTELNYPPEYHLHGVIFAKHLMQPLFSFAVNKIGDHDGTIVNRKGSSAEWFTHVDPNNGGAYFLPPQAHSEQDISVWFQVVLCKSALGFCFVLKAIPSTESKPKTRSSTRIELDLHPKELHNESNAFISSAPRVEPSACNQPSGKPKKPNAADEEDDDYNTVENPSNFKLKGSIPDVVLINEEEKVVCTMEVKTEKSMPNETFRTVYETTIDRTEVVIPFTWPTIDTIDLTETKILVQVFCQMLRRNCEYAILTTYEATFFMKWTKKTVEGNVMNILVVIGPFYITNIPEFIYPDSPLKVGHIYAWFALNLGLIPKEALGIDVDKFDITLLGRKHRLKPKGGLQTEIVDEYLQKPKQKKKTDDEEDEEDEESEDNEKVKTGEGDSKGRKDKGNLEKGEGKGRGDSRRKR